MSKYVLIESSEPVPGDTPGGLYDMARDLAVLGHEVKLFLVQNAVFVTRRGVRCEPLRAAVAAGVAVLADDFSLRERGIGAARLVEHVKPWSVDAAVEDLAAGAKALWH